MSFDDILDLTAVINSECFIFHYNTTILSFS